MKFLPLFLSASLTLAGSLQAGVVVIGSLARTTINQPGEAFEGVILIKNTDKIAADIRISQTDYVCRADGSNDFGEPGKTERSNAGWMTLTPTRVKLASGETQPIRYKGRVPAVPSLHGTFWSMVMVEPNSAPAIAPDGKPDQIAIGLSTTIRFAVQIVTEIGQSGTRSLKVQEKSILKKDGKSTLQLDIGNDGERLLVPMVSVELFNKEGASIGRFEAGRSRIYPTCSVRSKVDLGDVPLGNYTAMVLLDSGDAQVMGAQYDLEITP